jgi:hypothetical protein
MIVLAWKPGPSVLSKSWCVRFSFDPNRLINIVSQDRITLVDNQHTDADLDRICASVRSRLEPHLEPSWLPWIRTLFPNYKQPTPPADEGNKTRREEVLTMFLSNEISFSQYEAMLVAEHLASPGSSVPGSPIAGSPIVPKAEVIDIAESSTETTPVKKGKRRAKAKVKAKEVKREPSPNEVVPDDKFLVRFYFFAFYRSLLMYVLDWL